MPNPILPLIHHNGSGADSLLKNAKNTHDALKNAVMKMLDSQPNGRDYYPLPDLPDGRQAFSTAYDHYTAMLKNLAETLRHYEIMMEYVQQHQSMEIRIAHIVSAEGKSYFNYITGAFDAKKRDASPLMAGDVAGLFAKYRNEEITLSNYQKSNG